MRINEYKRALEPIPDNDLDRLVAVRSNNTIHFEPADAPPERWSRFLGVVVHAPGRTTPESGEPVSLPEIGDLAHCSQASRHFIAGFMKDLKKAFGENIVNQCFTHPGLSGSTPITARTVREVIAQAEQAHDSVLVAVNDALVRAAIETSPTFSPRQKQMLNEWFARGPLSLDQIGALSQLAEWAQQQTSCQLLPSLSGDRPEHALIDLLEGFAHKIKLATNITIENQKKEETSDAALRKNDYRALASIPYAAQVALVTAGLTILDAKTLLEPLFGNVGAIALDIMRNKSRSFDLVAQLHEALKESLLQRSSETEEDFHPSMANGPDQKVDAEPSMETLPAPPKGDTVPKAPADAQNSPPDTRNARFMEWAAKDAIAQAELQKQMMRMTNNYNLRTYFDHGMWHGILPQAEGRNDDRPLGENAVPEVLDEHAAQFVKALITARCQELPSYALEPLKLDQFVAIAKSVLDLYNEIRTRPMMTPRAVNITFLNAHRDILANSVDETLRRLPIRAATACLYTNLDPNVPDSFMSQAVQHTWHDSPAPEPSERLSPGFKTSS